MFNRVLVTYKDNLIVHDDGTFDLTDSSLVGHLIKTHPLTAQSFNPETQMMTTGVVFKSEVYWEHARSPSPSFEDPEALAWINFNGEENDEEENEEESDYDEESRQDDF